MISIHTFELTMDVDSEKFHKWRNKVKHVKTYNKEEDKDYTFVDDGITVWFPNRENDRFKRKIRLLVNPSRLFGFDDVVELWKPKTDNILKMLIELEKFIENYFNNKYDLENFKLSRIDFTTNIRLDEPKIVTAYIRVLHNIRKVKGFSPQYNKSDDWYNEDHSFDLEGNSNDIEFTAYDKAAAIEKNKSEFKRKEREARAEQAKGLLRLEVKLTTQKVIRKYTNTDITAKQIIHLCEQSRDIFTEIFARIVPYGDFYMKDKAVKIIEESAFDKKMKNKMLKLLELIPTKKSLHLAIKEMNDRNIDEIIKCFAQLNVSPVTISKRHKVKHLKNLYCYLFDE